MAEKQEQRIKMRICRTALKLNGTVKFRSDDNQSFSVQFDGENTPITFYQFGGENLVVDKQPKIVGVNRPELTPDAQIWEVL